jgi:hypothetical protein
MATTEDVQVQFGASIEGLTAGSYEPRDLVADPMCHGQSPR